MKNTTMTLGIIGLSAVCGLASSVSADIVAEFQLADHTHGDVAPGVYGLRLDNMINDGGTSGIVVLQMNHFNNSTLVVEEEAGSISIHIQGTLWGGQVEAGAFVDAQAYEMDFTYSANVVEVADGWTISGFRADNNGTLTNVDTNEVMDLYGKANMQGLVFDFLSDGFRIPGDFHSFVGRGWLTGNSDGSMSNDGAQDWLFTATQLIVPAPSSIAFLGLGGLVATRRRR